MEDCSLERLGIRPGTLSPAFNKYVTSYSVALASDVESLVLDPRTSDNGASYEIRGGDGGKTIALQQGAKLAITIRVTAEDGRTTRDYVVTVHRLSAKDASLASLVVLQGSLEPDFGSDQLNYECHLSYATTTLKVDVVVSDPKIAVSIQADAMSDGSVSLNLGSTKVLIEVQSADRSTKRLYTLTALRGPCLRHIQLTDAAHAAAFEDPVSLSLLHRPVSIRTPGGVGGSGGTCGPAYSARLLEALIRASRSDPIDGSPLPPGEAWRCDDPGSAESRLSACPAVVEDSRGRRLATGAAREVGAAVAAAASPAARDLRRNYQHCRPEPTACSPGTARPWERRLRNIFDVSDAKLLAAMAEKCIQEYLDSLPGDPASSRVYPTSQSPQDHLARACSACACAIEASGGGSGHRLHLRLGQLLEEMQHCQDVFGMPVATEGGDGSGGGGGAASGADSAARDSAKEDEIDAICRLRGVSESAGLGAKLRALDAEMRHLGDQGQSSRADAVQSLFLWKSRQATADGAAQQRAAAAESPLSRALDKYQDALSLADSDADLHCHVGRLLLARGAYADAARRLEAALSWQPAHAVARLYLGASLARLILQQPQASAEDPGGGHKQRQQEALELLEDGAEVLVTQALTAESSPRQQRRQLLAESPLRLTNYAPLWAGLALGQLQPDPHRRRQQLHQACLLASVGLAALPPRAGAQRGLVRRLLIDCHAALLPAPNSPDLLAARCRSLSALIAAETSVSGPTADTELAALQRRVCETLVRANPFWAPALCQLGAAQLARAETTAEAEGDDQRRQWLADAEASLRAAIELEGRPSGAPVGSAAPELVRRQDWWQRAEAAEAAPAAAASAESASAPSAPSTASAPSAIAKGGAGGKATPAPARGGGGRGGGSAAPSSRGGGGAPTAGRGGAPTAGRGGATAPVRGGAAKGRGGAAASQGGAKTAGATAAVTPAPAATHAEPPPPPSQPTVVATSAEPPPTPPPLNRPSAAARLALARTLRAAGGSRDDEALAMFEAAQKLAPDCHDAYIEAADMLLASPQPLRAVDVYCQFPLADAANPTFDDAYIFGEIVRLLVKYEKFDDPRLPDFMVKWGRVMGLPILDKYIAALEAKGKSDVCKSVFAGVNGRSVDDLEMRAFFKARCWE